MKKQILWIALGALVLPILLRTLWFYTGIPSRPEIATPDYASLTVPLPPGEPEAVDEEGLKRYGGIVVVDNTHANLYRPPELQSLKEAVEKRGGTLEFLNDSSMLENSLKYASAYLVFSPSTAFYSTEISLIRSFTTRGGRLAVFTDATRGLVYTDYYTGSSSVTPDANAVNPLLSAYGITINDDYLYNLTENEGNFRNVFFDEFGKAELTFGLKQIALYGTHSVESDSGLILLRGSDSTFSSITDAHDPNQGGAAISEDGNVVAFGDFTFLTHPYQNVGDNATLIASLADFLLSGERAASLATFPYIFDQTVIKVFITPDVQLTAEMVGALSGLQSSLRAVNASMEITSEKPADGDGLILGTFEENDDLEPYFKKFDIEIDDEFITLPGIGNIGRTGNGLLLFEPGKKGRTLILLADTLEDLISLVDVVNSGSLSSCVLQDQVGVCSVGIGGSFSDGEGLGDGFSEDGIFDEGLFTPEETPGEGTATPEPEATPAG